MISTLGSLVELCRLFGKDIRTFGPYFDADWKLWLSSHFLSFVLGNSIRQECCADSVETSALARPSAPWYIFWFMLQFPLHAIHELRSTGLRSSDLWNFGEALYSPHLDSLASNLPDYDTDACSRCYLSPATCFPLRSHRLYSGCFIASLLLKCTSSRSLLLGTIGMKSWVSATMPLGTKSRPLTRD